MHNYNTRYAMKGNIYNNYDRTTRFGLKSLQNMGGKIWEFIPKNTRDSRTLASFISIRDCRTLASYKYKGL